MSRRMNLVGDVYGEYTVLEFSHTTPNNGMSHYLCRCSCGTEKLVSHGNLRSNHTLSCGCKRPKGKDVHNFVHGFQKNHKTYKSWCKIKERCFNPNDKSYPSYGGSGITFQKELSDNFLEFYNEVGEPPSDGQRWSIDRIDNTKGYEKGNMRWATDFQQARNKGKMSNNTSGVTGVHWEEKVHPNGKNSTTYAVAQWKEYDQNGEQVHRKKSFSEKKLGLIPAFMEAANYRREMLNKLRAQGYEYSENHGE